jgi:hypothetical protein
VGDAASAAPRPFVGDARSQRIDLTIASISGRAFTVERPGFTVDWQLER